MTLRSIRNHQNHSVAGKLKEVGLMNQRPLGSASYDLQMWHLSEEEVTHNRVKYRWHNGVLFLDELPEFKRDALEVMSNL
jgi:magnesium chelatase family protein